MERNSIRIAYKDDSLRMMGFLEGRAKPVFETGCVAVTPSGRPLALLSTTLLMCYNSDLKIIGYLLGYLETGGETSLAF